MPKKPSKTAIIEKFGETKNIRKTAEALGISWHTVYQTLVDAKVDLYHCGHGVRQLAA